MKSLIYSFCLLSFVCLFTDSWAREEEKLPSLRVSENVHEFGVVAEGTIVEHEFVVQNVGNADLLLDRIVAACGCTAAATSSNTIAAGQEEIIKVSFDTTGFSGEKLKTVRLYTNDPDQLTYLLSLKGSVESDVSVEPRRVFIKEWVKGDVGQEPIELTIKASSSSKAQITDLLSYSEFVTLEQVVKEPKLRKVRVSVSPEVPVGDLRERIVVKLSNSARKSLNIPVFVAVRGSVKLEPEVVSFGVLTGTEPLKRVVKFENRSDKQIKLTSVKSQNPALTAQVETIKEGFKYSISLTLDLASLNEDLRTSLSIITDDQEQGELVLDVFGVKPPKL